MKMRPCKIRLNLFRKEVRREGGSNVYIMFWNSEVRKLYKYVHKNNCHNFFAMLSHTQKLLFPVDSMVENVFLVNLYSIILNIHKSIFPVIQIQVVW